MNNPSERLILNTSIIFAKWAKTQPKCYTMY